MICFSGEKQGGLDFTGCIRFIGIFSFPLNSINQSFLKLSDTDFPWLSRIFALSAFTSCIHQPTYKGSTQAEAVFPSQIFRLSIHLSLSYSSVIHLNASGSRREGDCSYVRLSRVCYLLLPAGGRVKSVFGDFQFSRRERGGRLVSRQFYFVWAKPLQLTRLQQFLLRKFDKALQDFDKKTVQGKGQLQSIRQMMSVNLWSAHIWFLGLVFVARYYLRSFVHLRVIHPFINYLTDKQYTTYQH